MKTQFKDENISNSQSLDNQPLKGKLLGRRQSNDGAACQSPAIGAKLPDYIVNLLDDDAAFEVEQHLVDCKYCKHKYLLVLRVQRAAALRGKAAASDSDADTTLSNESLEELEVGNHCE